MPDHDLEPVADDYDTPWKEVLETYFKDFLAFYLPVAHDNIDWGRGHEFLDKELARISREADTGDRRMDKLVKVWEKNGDERWVLIHVEIQGDREQQFQARMYTYQYRAFDLKQKPVVGLAVLTDDEQSWRPTEYSQEMWGTRILYQFTAIKLIDYWNHLPELELSDNPFAIVTLAHLQARKTRNQPEKRFQSKLALVKNLYRRGLSQQDVVNLFRFIDWVLSLPKEADQQFWQELTNLEERQEMPFITSVERIGIEKGILIGEQRGLQIGEQRGLQIGEQRGLQIGEQRGEQRGKQIGMASTLIRQLQKRFGQVPDWIQEKIAAAESETLEVWAERIFDADTVEGIFQ